MTIEWKEPPARTNRRWKDVVAEIKANPGQWAYVGNLGASSAYTYAKRFGLEVQTANRNGSTCDVYFRAPEVN